MDFKEVGNSQLREVSPTVALKDGKVLKPISLLHNKEKNILLIFVLAPIQGIEWEISDLIEEVYNETKARELIIPDGFIGPTEGEVYYLTHKDKDTAIKKHAEKLEDAVLTGVIPALLLKDVSLLGIFGNLSSSEQARIKASSGIPSNKIAVNVLKVLNAYLNLSVDTKTLEEMGEEIEKQFGEYMEQITQQKEQQNNQQDIQKPTRYIR
jgi:predicted ATP-grasp superfamily ATP-dependent carboligase